MHDNTSNVIVQNRVTNISISCQDISRVGALQSSEDTSPPPETFARRYAAKAVDRALQPGRIERRQAVASLAQHRVTILGQFIEIVQQVDVQELGGQLLGEARLHTKIELPVTELEDAVALVVVNQRFVVELGRPQTHAICRPRARTPGSVTRHRASQLDKPTIGFKQTAPNYLYRVSGQAMRIVQA